MYPIELSEITWGAIWWTSQKIYTLDEINEPFSHGETFDEPSPCVPLAPDVGSKFVLASLSLLDRWGISQGLVPRRKNMKRSWLCFRVRDSNGFRGGWFRHGKKSKGLCASVEKSLIVVLPEAGCPWWVRWEAESISKTHGTCQYLWCTWIAWQRSKQAQERSQVPYKFVTSYLGVLDQVKISCSS